MSFYSGPEHWAESRQEELERAQRFGMADQDTPEERLELADRRVHLEVNPSGCKCVPLCEMPCHDRVGIAPACRSCGCPPFPVDLDQDEIAA